MSCLIMLPKISSTFVLIMRPVVPGLTATFIYLFVYFGVWPRLFPNTVARNRINHR